MDLSLDEGNFLSVTVFLDILGSLLYCLTVFVDVLGSLLNCFTLFVDVLGSLLNVAVDDIIEAVTHIEEFSADDCQYLQSVLDHLATSSIELFRINVTGTSAEVTTHESVADWLKLKELSMLMGSNLQRLRDRWADGKGPLALYFTGAEVVKLVVAMFEKTTKRDAIVVELQRRHSVHLT